MHWSGLWQNCLRDMIAIVTPCRQFDSRIVYVTVIGLGLVHLKQNESWRRWVSPCGNTRGMTLGTSKCQLPYCVPKTWLPLLLAVRLDSTPASDLETCFQALMTEWSHLAKVGLYIQSLIRKIARPEANAHSGVSGVTELFLPQAKSSIISLQCAIYPEEFRPNTSRIKTFVSFQSFLRSK